MIQPQLIPLFCPIGAEFDQQMQFISTQTGLPTDLTGATAVMRIYTGQIDANGAMVPFLTLTTENGGISVDAETGTLSFFIDEAVTATFPTVGLATKTVDMGGNCSCEGELTGYAANYSLSITLSGNTQQYASAFSTFLILPR